MKHTRPWAAQLIVTILAFASPALGQTSWWRTYGGTSTDVGCSVQQTTEGGYIIAGMTMSSAQGAMMSTWSRPTLRAMPNGPEPMAGQATIGATRSSRLQTAATSSQV